MITAIRLAEQNKDIPTAEIKQDILDTENDIAQAQREEKGYRIIGDRMSIFRANARINSIKEMQDFIKDLKSILKVRKEIYK